ncbi:MAG: C4-type zinc ribbon domain-containing protein [Deltaproteobacteria bacterium]|nr:C4-type zinc ribbon domain-containing protein [Deltaproteobacteria bacterium]
MSNYLKQIEQLVELQKVDDRIHLIRKDLTNAPKEIEKLKADFQAAEKERIYISDKLEQLKEQEKRLNLDIDDDESRIKKSRGKLMQVGNSREYQAMMREMDSMEKMNRDREAAKKRLAEELLSQESIFAEAETRYASLKENLEDKEAGLPERMEKAQDELKNLDERRREAGRDIPLPVLSRYEFIRERLEYPVIVPVFSGICNGCNISIPPQSYIELQKGRQILSCPNCQRLIYWSEHFRAEN